MAKHRHKWEEDYEECHKCGGSVIEICECGTVRDKDTKEIICE